MLIVGHRVARGGFPEGGRPGDPSNDTGLVTSIQQGKTTPLNEDKVITSIIVH